MAPLQAVRRDSPPGADLQNGLSAKDIADRLAKAKGRKAVRAGAGWNSFCPVHENERSTPSLTISDGVDRVLFHCKAGCDQAAVARAIQAMGLALGPNKQREADDDTSGSIATLITKGFRIAKAYPYLNAAGVLEYEKVRLERQNGRRIKQFRQRRPNGRGGWIESLGTVRRLPYRLPELLARPNEDVHICEGEKDADSLTALGLVATSVDLSSDKSHSPDLSVFAGRDVYIHEDNDTAGRAKSAKLAAALAGIAADVRIVRYVDTPDGGDVTDWLEEDGRGLEKLLTRCDEAPNATTAPVVPVSTLAAIDWPDSYEDRHRGRRQGIANSVANVRHFLDVRGVTLVRNQFSLRNEITLDGETTEFADDKVRQIWLEAYTLGLASKKDFFAEVCIDLARQNPHHPVRSWLELQRWDGTERVSNWLIAYAGAADTHLNRAIGRAFLVAAVRRIRNPGSKFDNILMLEGPQYAGKSTLVRVLASADWFSDSLQVGTDPKDTIEQTGGKWICELAELDGMAKKTREKVKAFLSRRVDRAALKWDRMARDVPRQFVCVGTTNAGEYLEDPTGNRRFWPCRIGAIDIAALERDRAQLWAEAVQLEATGESTELPPDVLESAAREQESRIVADPYFDRLEPVLENEVGAVAKADLWRFLGIQASHQDPHVARRMNDAMRRLEFVPKKLRSDGSGGRKPGELVPCYVRDGWSGDRVPWVSVPSVPT